MSEATKIAREQLGKMDYERARTWAAIAQAEAAEKQADALSDIARVLKDVSGNGDKSLNVYTMYSDI